MWLRARRRNVLEAPRMPGEYRQKRWREAERVRVDVNAMMAHMLDGGIGEAELDALVPRLADAHASIARQRRAGLMAFLELPTAKAELKRTLALADDLRGEFDDLVVLAIGGSALGTRALYGALRPSDHAWRAPS